MTDASKPDPSHLTAPSTADHDCALCVTGRAIRDLRLLVHDIEGASRTYEHEQWAKRLNETVQAVDDAINVWVEYTGERSMAYSFLLGEVGEVASWSWWKRLTRGAATLRRALEIVSTSEARNQW